jgi:hypothetical protein
MYMSTRVAEQKPFYSDVYVYTGSRTKKPFNSDVYVYTGSRTKNTFYSHVYVYTGSRTVNLSTLMSMSTQVTEQKTFLLSCLCLHK